MKKPLFLLSSLMLASVLVSTATNAQDYIEYVEEKPEVAEVEPNNTPNRVVANFYQDTQTEMAFNWYTTDLFEDAVVLISTSEDMSDAIEVETELTEVVNEYAERTEDGYFIFADVEMVEEGDEDVPVRDDDGELVVGQGYFTDEGYGDEID